MVVFDATTLLLLLSPNVPAPLDPTTNKPITFAKDRIDYLVKELGREKTKIIVPTPVLSEILVRAGSAGSEYLDTISTSAAFRIVPFDVRAAVEVAAMTQKAMGKGNKRSGSEGTWAKIKYDRQIVAIAKTEGALVIYSDDGDVQAIAASESMVVVSLRDLPIPPDSAQGTLAIEVPTKEEVSSETEDKPS